MTRDGQGGVSLLNVLAALAVGTTLVQVMLRDQDVALQHLDAASRVAQAHNLARGGVTSVAVALRRDWAEAPDTDHLNEVWAQSAQDKLALDFGQFEVSIRDARGKFDLNALQPAALAEQRVFARLLAVLDLPEVLGRQITQIVSQHGPLTDVTALAQYGIARGDLARLAPHVTAATVRGDMNLNAVSEPLMAALLGNPTAARGLVARRAAKGFLDRSDLVALGLAQPQLSGFTSDIFDVRAIAEVGNARAVRARRLVRDPETGVVQDIAQP